MPAQVQVKRKGLPRGCRVLGAQGADGKEGRTPLALGVAKPSRRHQRLRLG